VAKIKASNKADQEAIAEGRKRGAVLQEKHSNPKAPKPKPEAGKAPVSRGRKSGDK